MIDRFAAIADIHGNADALSAVLADIDAQGVETVVNLGDHLSGPLAPTETLALLRARPGMVNIRGNHDRWLVQQTPDQMYDTDRLTHAALGASDLDWLRALPATVQWGDVFLCHATPGDDLTYWLDCVTPEGAVVMRDHDGIAALARDVAASLILCGHTHLARAVRLKDGRLIVNPGSVGQPAFDDDLPCPHVIQSGSPDARYALLTRRAAGWEVTFRAVPYDPSRMIALAQSAGQGDWAGPLRTGWLR